MGITPRSAIAVMMFGVAAGAYAAPQYSVIEIGRLDGGFMSVQEINNAGTVVGNVMPVGGGDSRPFVHSNGSSAYFGTTTDRLNGINDAGLMVGTTFNGNVSKVYTSTGGAFSILPNAALDNASVAQISNSGNIVGTSQTQDGKLHAFSIVEGVYTALAPLQSGYSTYGTGINDLGQVSGWGSSDAGVYGFVYSNGVMTDVGSFVRLIPGSTINPSLNTYARAINNVGQVVGMSSSIQGSNAFLFANGNLTALGTLPGFTPQTASAINATGAIVGSGANVSGLSGALLWQDGQVFDLSSIVGFTLTSAVDVNDIGQIVVYGLNERTYLLTPSNQPVAVPLPHSFLLIGIGILILCVNRRKAESTKFA